jgi:phosphatidylserine decarboxylase
VLGAHGCVQTGLALQAKGHAYPLAELLNDPALAADFEGAQYASLRLTAGMYHRFHAPADCSVEQVDFMAGDVWNVNPAALARVRHLYCRNERAVLRCRLDSGEALLLVPIAAVLVASLKLHCLQHRLHLRYRGPTRLRCRARYARGQELGWFEQGSTIIVLAPPGCMLAAGRFTGGRLQMGEALFRRAGPA